MLKQYQLDSLKRQYPAGTIVELIEMDDLYAPPAGTRGEVVCVDSIGTIHVRWENGSGLGLVYGHDQFKKVTELKETI